MLTNNDRDRQLPGFAKDDTTSTAATPSSGEAHLDDDLAKMELRNNDTSLTEGTFRIELSNPGAVRLFNDDGRLLNDLSVDLASPSGDLESLATAGHTDIWLEATATDSNFVFSLVYEDAEGNEICRDKVHILLAELTIRDDADAEIDFVAAFSKETLLIAGDAIDLPPPPSDSTTKPSFDPRNIDPLPSDDILYKVRADQLTRSALKHLDVTSNDVESDYYRDDLVESGTALVSNDFAVVYWADPSDVMKHNEKVRLLDNVQLNTVHGKSATIELKTIRDQFKRPLPAIEITPISPDSIPVGGRVAVDFSSSDTAELQATATLLPDADDYDWQVLKGMPTVGYSTSGSSSDTFSLTVEDLGRWLVGVTYTLAGQTKTVRIYVYVGSTMACRSSI